MSMIKGRNGKDLTEAAEIKKRWQEYKEELYQKGLNDQDNRDDVVTHQEWDILESEVTQSCPTLCDPMDCSLPGFSVRGIS